MAIESLWLLIIAIVAAQISLLLATVIAAVEYFWLLIIGIEFIDCQGHKMGAGLYSYFSILRVQVQDEWWGVTEPPFNLVTK